MNHQWEVQCSSVSVEYPTPRPLFAGLHAEFKFDVDVCATPDNACLPRYFTAEQDGLAQNWNGLRLWMNPPYGDPEQPCKKRCDKKKCEKRGHHVDRYIPGIRDWMAKAAAAAACGGALVVALVPSRTDTKWWHDHVWDVATNKPRPGVEVRFLKGRVTFVGAAAPAPFASAVVIFRPWAG